MKFTTKNQELLNNYSNIDLEILPNIVKKNGFDYILVERVDGKCIYQQTKNNVIYGYEVFKTKIVLCRDRLKKLCERYERKFEEDRYKEFKEQFPGDEEFGKRAWACKTLEKAIDIYNRI